jgi:hypothetical protein
MINDIGIVGAKNNIGNAGVGFVVVPEGIDRLEYIENCYRTNTIAMSGGTGYGYFFNVNVDSNVMQHIQFPTNIDEDLRGTAVVWVKDSIHNVPVVVASLRKQDDFYILDENQYLVKRETETTSVVLFADGSKSLYEINVIGNKENPGNINIKVTSENKDSVFNLYVDNELNVTTQKKINVVSEDEISIKIKKDGEVKTEVTYKRETGLTYRDEFENEVTFKDGEINVVSDKINHNSGKEPMVLGDTLANLLDDLLKAIQQMTVMTAVGASSVPVNVATFAQIQSKINNIKSEKSNLE